MGLGYVNSVERNYLILSRDLVIDRLVLLAIKPTIGIYEFLTKIITFVGYCLLWQLPMVTLKDLEIYYMSIYVEDSTKRLFTTKTSPEVDENTSKVRKTSRKTFVMCSNDIEVDKSNRSNNTVKSY